MSLVVRAWVVDLRQDAPKANDGFLVDTNVWYWLTYPNASGTGKHYQTSTYPQYIRRAIQAGATLFYSVLMLAELAHVVEKTELTIFENANPHLKGLGLKDFRHKYPQKRANVVDTIEAVWGQVMQYSALSSALNNISIEQALALLPSVQVDGYDLLILQTAQQSQVSHIISDDSDFATVEGIVLFTANERTIRSAREQKRLLVR
jgi:predicted nucleic acid-binding protein